MNRYPVQDLIAVSGLTEDAFRRRARISGATWEQVREVGATADQADRWSVRCGLDAYVVWPELLDDVIAAAHVKCEAPDCPETFIPESGFQRKARRFCSRRCQLRTNARLAYQRNPDTRARKIAGSARYREEVREIRARRAS